MMIKKILFVFFVGLVLAGCQNPLYNEEEITSPDDVMSISVIPPNKRLYNYGDPFKPEGMKVTIYFRDSEKYPPEEIEDTAKIGVSGYKPYEGGIQTISVSAGGKSDTFKIALMVIPDFGQLPPVVIGGRVTLLGAKGRSTGSWDVYVYNAADKNQVYTKSGSDTGSISFPASVPGGEYTLAVAFRIDAKMYYEFYKLTVN